VLNAAVIAGALALSWLLTRVVLGYAEARLVDLPNARSSHARATPRGGGLAVVLAFLLGLAVLAWAGRVPLPLALALGPGAAAVAAIGWLDDHGHVAARWRTLVHVAAALWALAWLGGLPTLELGGWRLPLGAAGWVIGVLGVVWVTNLYNFMDGIDGLAAGEAVSLAGCAALLLFLSGAPALVPVTLLLAAASAGFLPWNWAPARIFLGDVASGTLGYLFAVLALASERAGALPLLAWVLLAGVFVFDATATLLRRLLRGEKVYEAHRSHAYQRATDAGFSHAAVTGRVLLLNALLAGRGRAAALRPALLLPACAAGVALLGLGYLRVERAQPMRPPPAPRVNAARVG
jgi:Fuc2NAc and GlcNAc transferase